MTRLDDRPLALWTMFAGELAQSSCLDESIALLQNVVKSLKSTTRCEVSEELLSKLSGALGIRYTFVPKSSRLSTHVTAVLLLISEMGDHRWRMHRRPEDLEMLVGCFGPESEPFVDEVVDTPTRAAVALNRGRNWDRRWVHCAREVDYTKARAGLWTAYALAPLDPIILAHWAHFLIRGTRFQCPIDLSVVEQDAENAALLARKAILTFSQSCSLTTSASIVGCVLAARAATMAYHHGHGDTKTLQELSDFLDNLVARVSPRHYLYSSICHSIAGVHDGLYRTWGRSKDLDKCIEYCEASLARVDPDTDMAMYMHQKHNLATSLVMRYEISGSPLDRVNALEHSRSVVALARRHQSPLAVFTGGLVQILLILAGHDEDVLEESIMLSREALADSKTPERMHPNVLRALARALISRHQRTGDRADLSEAIHCLRKASAIMGPRAPDWPRIASALSSALRQDFGTYRSSEALWEASALYQELIEQHPTDYQRSLHLNDAGDTYRLIYTETKKRKYLCLAVDHHRRALDMRSVGHPERHTSLAAIAEDLALHNDDGLNTVYRSQEVMELQREAVRLLEPDHSEWSHYLVGLAKLRTSPDSTFFDIQQALDELLQALSSPHRAIYLRITEVMAVLQGIERDVTPSWPKEEPLRLLLLDLYREISALLPKLATFDQNIHTRMRVLAACKDLPSYASAHALILGHTDEAIDLLETGRAVFWMQYLRLRSSFTEAPEDVRKELAELSQQLAFEDTPHAQSSSTLKLGLEVVTDNHARAASQFRAGHRRQLCHRMNKLILDVRARPGYSHFLMTYPFSRWRGVADKGPVAILTCSGTRAWVVLIRSTVETDQDHDCCILDLDITDAWLQEKAALLRSDTMESRKAHCSRGIRASTVLDEEISDIDLLQQLWDRIGRPIIIAMGWKDDAYVFHQKTGVTRNRPRLFLCAAGVFSFLPLHAAGSYPTPLSPCNSDSFSDYCVVSYTPTLAALVDAREGYQPVKRKEVKLLVMVEPSLDGAQPLPQASEDLAAIRAVVSSSSLVSAIDPSQMVDSDSDSLQDAPGLTVAGVLVALPYASLVHFACHGHQDPYNALSSGFRFRDGTLTVADLMQLKLPDAKLAFLSACETAKGDKDQPDQVVHLAAAMMFAGFTSVIGTMWSMGDIDGPVVAETVYGQLFRDEQDHEMLDLDLVPYALDDAVRKLREAGLPPSRWATYVHLGA